MVDSPVALSKSGLRDWVIQRVTAVIIAAYFIFIGAYIVFCANTDFPLWHTLFAHPVMKIFSLLALISVLYHAWIGLWIVFTDYVKCAFLRLALQVAVIILLFSYVVWGITILW